MSNTTASPRYQGLFPVVPTTFTETGELDLASQKRSVDFMIDAGSMACASSPTSPSSSCSADDERELLTRTVLEHVAGRVPVIVTTTHFSTRVCAERSRRAQAMGAAMVMVMPPYHGATFRVPEAQIYEFYAAPVGRGRHSDHDAGRAGSRHAVARARSWRAWRARSSTSRTSRSRPRAPRPSCAS